MRTCLVVLALLAGCMKPNISECEDGLACPSSLACDVPHNTCTPQPQLDACKDQPQGAPCSTDLTPNGACDRGTCLDIACGNGRVEPGEVCDDGNTTSGDGCRGDCLSDERCANGLIDPGETCDDGNLASHDGCDSRCQVETLTWFPLVPIAAPTVVIAGAYDTDRQQMIAYLVGGHGTMTALWDGRSWRDVRPAAQPQYRTGTAMAYDPSSHRVVLFGGTTSSENNETWLWDGTRWTFVQPPLSPPARTGHTLIYDPNRGHLIMFGGTAGVNWLDDIWEWDGSTWAPVITTTTGPQGVGLAAAYDEVGARIVVFGGIDQNGTAVADTWSWSGTHWLRLTPVMNPPPGAGMAMSYSPVTKTLVLSGSDHTWQWHGGDAAWSEDLGVEPVPFVQRGAHVSFFDPLTQTTMIVGGQQPFARYVGAVAGWAQSADPAIPEARAAPSLVYDPTARAAVMTGGLVIDDFETAITWSLVGGSWQGVTTAVHPPPNPGRQGATFDEQNRVVTVFGDRLDDSVYTWSSKTRAWTQIAPWGPAWPAARSMNAMAYDAEIQRTVMFGGGNGTGTLDDTWLWDGTTWTPTPADAPHPDGVVGHVMAYDSARKTIVLFGGAPAAPVDRPVWEWRGGWTAIVPSDGNAPAPRVMSGMAFDPAVGETIVVGGQDANDAPLSDAWSWNGARWRKLQLAGIPTQWAQHSIGLAYDAALAGLVVYGDWGAEPGGVLRWTSATGVDEVCRPDVDIDADGDGLTGSYDADCQR
jgi:cysteine-rich repeat protein